MINNIAGDDYTDVCNNVWLMIDSIGDYANVLFNLNVTL